MNTKIVVKSDAEAREIYDSLGAGVVKYDVTIGGKGNGKGNEMTLKGFRIPPTFNEFLFSQGENVVIVTAYDAEMFLNRLLAFNK